jgi:hypothetical protein
VSIASKLFDQLLRDYIRFPNHLPAYTNELMAFPGMKSHEGKYYKKLMVSLLERQRPDLVILSSIPYTNSLIAQGKLNESTDILLNVALQCYTVEEQMVLIFNQLNNIPDSPVKQQKLLRFYLEFLPRVLKPESKIRKSYRCEYLQKALSVFEKAGQQEYVRQAQQDLSALDNRPFL